MKSKNQFILLIVLLLITIASVFLSCKKDEENTNQLPTCKISAPANEQEITKGEIITISVEAEDSDGNIVEVKFFINGVEQSSTAVFPYQYEWHTDNENIGSHLITATSIDNNGGSTPDEITIEIIEVGNAGFNVDQTTGIIPLTVNFSDSSKNNPNSWHWDFGDGNTSTLQNPSHTYTDIGTYSVTLIAINNFSADTITKADYITSSNTGVFTDSRDGQTYDIVNIGGQVWFAENLNFEVTNSSWYDGDPANGDVYGRLYTWEAALAACPPGWHVPTDEEWKDLEMFLGMSQEEADGTGLRGTDEGTKLKSTSGWNEAGNGTNAVGFMALPGGTGNISGSFISLSNDSYLWSSTESFGDVWYRRLSFNTGKSIRDIPDGSSNTLLMGVRLVRD